MMRIGIIGAENSHCTHIARICNVEKRIPARVVAVWGEKRSLAETAARATGISTVVDDWREMAGHVDGVMIDHRHPKFHAEPAEFFLVQRTPCFVDKPFTYSLRDAKKLCSLARRTKTPITSFSVIPLEPPFQSFKKECRSIGAISHVNLTGPVDLRSEYGGVFFYGIHQVDAMVELLGTKVDRVHVIPNGKGGAAVISYKSGPTVTMNLVNSGFGDFNWFAVGEKKIVNHIHGYDPDRYLRGARTFIKMFRTGREPFTHERIIAPIAILEAMDRSLKVGKPVRVASV